MEKWAEYDRYGTKGSGGGQNRFDLNFGNHDSHAFIDLIAWRESETTKVHVFYAVLE